MNEFFYFVMNFWYLDRFFSLLGFKFMQIVDVFRKMKKKGFRIFFCSGFACQD